VRGAATQINGLARPAFQARHRGDVTQVHVEQRGLPEDFHGRSAQGGRSQKAILRARVGGIFHRSRLATCAQLCSQERRPSSSATRPFIVTRKAAPSPSMKPRLRRRRRRFGLGSLHRPSRVKSSNEARSPAIRSFRAHRRQNMDPTLPTSRRRWHDHAARPVPVPDHPPSGSAAGRRRPPPPADCSSTLPPKPAAGMSRVDPAELHNTGSTRLRVASSVSQRTTSGN
jgi:hypothetical protein